jgi:hypothetical protein
MLVSHAASAAVKAASGRRNIPAGAAYACTVAVEAAEHGSHSERLVQAAMLHCIYGNPYQRLALERTWLTPAVQGIAANAYEEVTLPSGELDQGLLGILADALEDAGCQSGAVLSHLRGSGPHIRGCWVVDAVRSGPRAAFLITDEQRAKENELRGWRETRIAWR